MKQAFFTSAGAESGTPGQGKPAFRPYAASSGVAPEQLAAVARYVRYEPPSPEGDRPPAPAPVRLALLNTPDAGRILCHSVRVDANGRGTGYGFTHVLLDVPGTVDALQAIHSWGSDQWQRGVTGNGGALPDVLYQPVAAVLDDAAFKQFLAGSSNRDLF